MSTKTDELKQTSLYEKHTSSGAKIVNFAGWAMPLEYSGILAEAKHTRVHCTLFDVSHMGQIRIIGPQTYEFLQKLTCNDVAAIEEGGIQYNLLLNGEGTIVDDMTVYHEGDSLLCIVNASTKEKDFQWMQNNLSEDVDVEIIDESDKISLLSLQGPDAHFIIEDLGINLEGLTYMHFMRCRISQYECVLSRSGYTGEDGFEIAANWDEAPYIWDILMDAGKKYGLIPAGLGARDILRLEAGYPLYGNDIDITTNPVEASLRWVVKEEKGYFLGRDKILHSLRAGPVRKRVGFVMLDKGVPRHNYPVYDNDGNPVGVVTSGTYSPNLDKFIGMAYVEKGVWRKDTVIGILIRGKYHRARIASFPFIVPKVKKKD